MGDNQCTEAKKRLCQLQLYFYQKYKVQLLNKGDLTGGVRGLVYRASQGNREDPTRIAPQGKKEHMFVFLELLLCVSEKYQKKLLQFRKSTIDLHGTDDRVLFTKFPETDNDVRRMILRGVNSIMANFPCPTIHDIADHACVDLKEVIQIAAGHGARFNYAFDSSRDEGEERNNEGLNGTKAMDDLLKKIRETMDRDKSLSEIMKKNTKIGWIYFWSDAFLRCFIKQKDNSVWILTVTICPPENEKIIRTLHPSPCHWKK